MAIRQEFVFTPPEGEEFIDINIWAQDLPDLERQEWLAAVDCQLALREQVLGTALQVETEENEKHFSEWKKIAETCPLGEAPPYVPRTNKYIWNEATIKDKPPMEYKPYNEVWLKYWNRYLKETGTKFEVKEIKDDNSIQ